MTLVVQHVVKAQGSHHSSRQRPYNLQQLPALDSSKPSPTHQNVATISCNCPSEERQEAERQASTNETFSSKRCKSNWFQVILTTGVSSRSSGPWRSCKSSRHEPPSNTFMHSEAGKVLLLGVLKEIRATNSNQQRFGVFEEASCPMYI